jgi:hypothetical protein
VFNAIFAFTVVEVVMTLAASYANKIYLYTTLPPRTVSQASREATCERMAQISRLIES